MNRREFLELCGVAGAAYALTPRARAVTADPKPPKRLILAFMTGGWDTTYALDPKDPSNASVPAGGVQMFEGLDVFCDVSRPGVTAFFERHASISAIVRGISVDAINHNECQRRIATGTREETRPDFGAIVAHDVGNDLPLPYLILHGTAWTGPYSSSSGRVGASNQIVELLGPGPDGELSDAEKALVHEYAQASAARARAIRGAAGYNRRRIDDFMSAIDRGERLRGLRAGFGSSGDALAWDRQLQLALDALEQDVSQSVAVSPLLGWDTHGYNAQQGDFHNITFDGLARLVDELSTRPGRTAGSKMIDDTVVVAFSEMSRYRYLDSPDPYAGKGHWPVTAALVAGAGVRGGRVYGGTDRESVALAVDLATGAPDPNGTQAMYSHFVGGVLRLCGVDAQSHISVRPYDAFVA
jgi:uncharacterized protein (DUF1501 family)